MIDTSPADRIEGSIKMLDSIARVDVRATLADVQALAVMALEFGDACGETSQEDDYGRDT